MLVPESSVRACDLARIGFGQTVAVTALQLACAAAAAVNGGYYYQPRLVGGIYAADGSVAEEIPVVLKNRTVSEEASRILASFARRSGRKRQRKQGVHRRIQNRRQDGHGAEI